MRSNTCFKADAGKSFIQALRIAGRDIDRAEQRGRRGVDWQGRERNAMKGPHRRQAHPHRIWLTKQPNDRMKHLRSAEAASPRAVPDSDELSDELHVFLSPLSFPLSSPTLANPQHERSLRLSLRPWCSTIDCAVATSPHRLASVPMYTSPRVSRLMNIPQAILNIGHICNKAALQACCNVQTSYKSSSSCVLL